MAAPAIRHARVSSGAFSTVRAEGPVRVTAWHAHASLTLGRVESGRRVLRVDGTAFDLAPGDGFVVPPDRAHAWAADDASAVTRVLSAGRAPSCAAARLRDPGWAAAFDAAFAAVEAGAADATERTAALLALTARLAPPEAAVRVLPGALRRARRLTREGLEESLDLPELGKRVGLSPWHLHRLYRAAWGLTPAEHRLEERLRLARRLLLDGASAAQAAAAAGFADQSHFTRAFRRLMGVPPGSWLRQVRRSHAPR